jgi:hypothetical protein
MKKLKSHYIICNAIDNMLKIALIYTFNYFHLINTLFFTGNLPPKTIGNPSALQ